MKIKKLEAADELSLDQLASLGRRLTEDQMSGMDLLREIRRAEKDLYWRLKASIDLLRDCDHEAVQQLEELKREAWSQFQDPVRGQADVEGGRADPKGRQLPTPGTLIVRRYKRQWKTARRRARRKGTSSHEERRNEYRFLVVEQPSTLLWLDEDDGPLYRNPTYAVRQATEQNINGWDFFGL